MDARTKKVLLGSLGLGLVLAGAVTYVPGLFSGSPETQSDEVAMEQTNAPEGEPSTNSPGDSEGLDPNSGVPLDGSIPSADSLPDVPPSPTVISENELGASSLLSQEVLVSTDSGDELFEVGDRLLRGGNYFGASQQYKRLAVHGSSGAELNFRLGLSQELSGDLALAAKNYQDSVRFADVDSIPQLRSLIGLARVWQKSNKHEPANTLLSELLLRFGGEAYPETLRSEMSLMLAECLRQQYFDPGEFKGTEWPIYFNTEPDPGIQIAEQDVKTPIEPIADRTSELTLIQKPGYLISGIVVDANVNAKLITELIRELSETAEIEIQVSSLARAALSGRTTVLQNRAISIAVWLDQLLSPFGLAWQQKERSVYIMTLDEMIETQQLEYLYARRGRLLRDVQINGSNKKSRCIALMHEGNDLVQTANYELAATKFDSARQLNPVGELGALLYFNNGLLRDRMDDRDHALEQFYNALDQSLDPALKSRSSAKIAKLELEAGRTENAVVAASRGLRLLSDPEQTVENLMVLAKAYLLGDKPYAANQALYKYSNFVELSEHRAMGSVFSSLARLEVSGPGAGLSNEANRLLRALTELPESAVMDYADALLVARAFRKVGLSSKSLDFLSKALDDVENPTWKNLILVEMAKQYRAQGDSSEASKYLDQATDLSGYPRAMLLKATISLEQKEIARCIQQCRSLLEYRTSEEIKQKTLVVLGKALQIKGDDYAAATCFAGVVPDFNDMEESKTATESEARQ